MGKGRHQRVITYNLSVASTREAFEEGLDHNEFETAEQLEQHPHQGHVQQRILKARNARQRSVFEEEPESEGACSTSGYASELTEQQQQLVLDLSELFGSQHAMELILDVFVSCGKSFEGAVQILSDMTAAQEAAQREAELLGAVGAAEDPTASGAGSSSAAGASWDPSTSAAAASPTAAPVCYWDMLHESEREVILSHLSARDLARVAWTCRDFAWRVRNGRINARTLVIPTGVSLSGIVGMVAGHPNARSISLVRWGASCLKDGDFNALIQAIGQGARSARRNVRVEALSLRGWPSLSDSNVLTLLDEFQDLRELDLSDCDNITDAALGPISRYQRAVEDTEDHVDAAHPPGPSAPAPSPGVAGFSSTPAASSTRVSGSGGSPQPAVAAAGGSGPGGGRQVGGGAQDVARTPAGSSVPVAFTAWDSVAAALPGARAVQGGEEGFVGGSSDDESVVGESEPGAEDDSGGEEEDGAMLLDEELAAREQRRERSRQSARQQPSAGTPVPPRPPATRQASGTGSPRMMTPTPPLSGRASGSQYTGILGSSPATVTPGSLHRHGHATLLGASPTAAAGGWLGGVSPPLGVSPSVGSLGKGGSLGSLGKALFGGGRFGSGSAVRTGITMETTPGSTTASGSARQRGLEVLCLAGCRQLSADGLRGLLAASLVKQCLRALDVSRCMRLTRAVLVLPPSSNLRVLKAAACHNLHEVVMQLPLNSPLQELWINNCKHLARLHVVAPRLTLLHVGGCRALHSLQLKCPRLTHLLANLCCRLTDIEPEEVTLQAVEELNLFGCRQLTTASLLALTVPCQSLQVLNLNGCNLVHDVTLPEHYHLRVLDVTGCKALLNVSCSATTLTTLTARACPRLVTLQLESCTGLQLLDVTNCNSLRTVTLPALQMALTALQAQPELSHVLAPGWARSPAMQAAQARVVSGAAAAARPSLSSARTTAPAVRATGCDSLPSTTALSCKVLNALHASAATAATSKK